MGSFPTPSGGLICTAGPSITEKEIDYVTDAITNGIDAACYAYIGRFEEQMAALCSTNSSFATSSCTGGLHLCLWAAGIGDGDEVIVPDMTWVASVAPVTYVGATPVFVDIDPETFCISPDSIEAAITPKTKAIIAVHSYGHPADMDRINEIAAVNNLFVLEDAAPSLGSLYKGKPTGGLADAGVFSFHGSKIAGAGEGGAIMTNEDHLMKEIRVIGNHGRDGGRMLTAVRWGTKYNMSNLQAAFALAQIERLDELVEKKRLNYKWYQEALKEIPSIEVVREHPDVRWNCWQTSIILDDTVVISQDECMAKLKEAGIDSRPFFPPISSLPMVGKQLRHQNPVSYRVAKRGINLPSRHDLTEEDVAYIADKVTKLLA